jgi:hypothetical protein
VKKYYVRKEALEWATRVGVGGGKQLASVLVEMLSGWTTKGNSVASNYCVRMIPMVLCCGLGMHTLSEDL